MYVIYDHAKFDNDPPTLTEEIAWDVVQSSPIKDFVLKVYIFQG